MADGPRLVETYPPEVVAIDPVALALRDIREGGGGTPSGMLTVRGRLDEGKADKLRAQWQEAHGSDKAGSTAARCRGEAAGYIDAEDASALRKALARHGSLVVQAALLDAAAALLRSEAGMAAMVAGSQDYGTLHEAWPEAEALAQALDAARPGWRTQADA